LSVECKDGSKCNWLEEHFHRSLSVCLPHFVRTWLHDYKGFLSQEDGYLDYSEWHVASWSLALGLLTVFGHEVFAALYVLISVRVVRDEYSEHSSLKEIDGELPYWFGVFGGVLVLASVFTGYSFEFGSLVKILPALFGL